MSYREKHDVLTSLCLCLERLKKLGSDLSNTDTDDLAGHDVRTVMMDIATEWFDGRLSMLNLGLSEKIMKKYDRRFEQLAKQSLSESLAKNCHITVDVLVSLFADDLIIPVTKLSVHTGHMRELDDLLAGVDVDKIDHLRQSVESAHNSHYDSSIVSGWNATIGMIHKTVETLGFDQFNKISYKLKMSGGRYKRFTRSYKASNLAELQHVNDKDLLWIIEFWGLIDKNQHDRLEICRMMRNGSAHYNKAQTTPENLLSFFSDLKKIVFANTSFRVS